MAWKKRKREGEKAGGENQQRIRKVAKIKASENIINMQRARAARVSRLAKISNEKWKIIKSEKHRAL